MSIVHGGNLEKLAAEAHCAPDEILDFSVNLNPCGQPEGLFQVWFRAFDHAAPYPEPYAESVCRMIAGKLSCPADCVLAGNGSGELLDLLLDFIQDEQHSVRFPPRGDRDARLSGI